MIDPIEPFINECSAPQFAIAIRALRTKGSRTMNKQKAPEGAQCFSGGFGLRHGVGIHRQLDDVAFDGTDIFRVDVVGGGLGSSDEALERSGCGNCAVVADASGGG
ncbi:hypothetical protein [Bradyrhizobium sp. CCH5-F6]|jgi:hypothetical protein|uniref:hypothetical protein n=1 Tax=Bradyrhizobium sp. CCH5-F6 TaxID=1768753 RepID=UPI000B2DF337|nr:hypothetical protein [Bradyrhizobium sp. CCH5-F6]